MTNENIQNQQTNQAQNQEVEKMVQQSTEAKTILNGKVVPVQEAQMAEQAFQQQNMQTGIQQHHDNSSEAVEAGKTGNQTSFVQFQAQQAQQPVRQTDLQSGQQHMEQHMQQAQQQYQQQQQQAQQQTNQSASEALEQQAQQQEAKTRATRARKTEQ